MAGWFPGFPPESFSLEQGVVSEFSPEKFSLGLHRYYGRCRKHLALINGVLMTHGPRQDFAGQAIRHALIREDLRPDDAALGVRRVGEERVTLHGQARYAGVHRQLAIWHGAVVAVLRDE